jgi:hypothetical protein
VADAVLNELLRLDFDARVTALETAKRAAGPDRRPAIALDAA